MSIIATHPVTHVVTDSSFVRGLLAGLTLRGVHQFPQDERRLVAAIGSASTVMDNFLRNREQGASTRHQSVAVTDERTDFRDGIREAVTTGTLTATSDGFYIIGLSTVDASDHLSTAYGRETLYGQIADAFLAHYNWK